MATTPNENGNGALGALPQHQSSPVESEADSLRARLVDYLQLNNTLHDAEVERAMRTVPRHIFLPTASLRDAYADNAVPTRWQSGFAISSASQPGMVAIMLEQLKAEPGMRVLEVGAGTGYNAALLSELVGPAGHVTTLDIDQDIVDEATTHLAQAGYTRVRAIATDGALGWQADAPYDRIILTVGASDITPAWFEQLADDGIIVLPMWLGGVEASIAFRKQGDHLESESLALCGFMRLRGLEASEEQWITLSNGRRLFGERIAEIAPAIERLLTSSPRRQIWQRSHPGFIQYLGLRGYRLFSLFPRMGKHGRAARPPRPGRWGIYVVEDGEPSAALFSYRLPLVIILGGQAAQRIVEREWARWQHVASAPVERWRVTAHPRPADDAMASPPGTLRLARRHFVFDITMAPTSPMQ